MKIQATVLIALMATFMCGPSSCQEHDAQVYCGRRLAQTLAVICANNYSVKRSDSSYNSVHFGSEPEVGWPWVPAARARGLSGARGKRQIVTECCEKACDFEEMLTYCY